MYQRPPIFRQEPAPGVGTARGIAPGGCIIPPWMGQKKYTNVHFQQLFYAQPAVAQNNR